MENNIVLNKVKEIVKKDILKSTLPFFGIFIDLDFLEMSYRPAYSYTFDGEDFFKFNDSMLENIENVKVNSKIIDKESLKKLSINNEIKYVLENIINKESLKNLFKDIKNNMDLFNQQVTKENGYIESIYITLENNELHYILLHCTHKDIMIKKEKTII